jgi:hypothetical protein
MNFLLIFPHYISWHYTKAISDLLNLFKDFARFIWTFFSIKLLLQTLFVPFQKLSVKRTKKLDLEDFFSALVTNLLMRLIGFVIRSFFILAGILSMIFFVIAYSVVFLIWIVLPLILISMFVLGFIALLKITQI